MLLAWQTASATFRGSDTLYIPAPDISSDDPHLGTALKVMQGRWAHNRRWLNNTPACTE